MLQTYSIEVSMRDENLPTAVQANDIADILKEGLSSKDVSGFAVRGPYEAGAGAETIMQEVSEDA